MTNMPDLLNLFFLGFFGSILALVGGVLFLYNKNWSEALERNSIPFAAGVLITVALVGLIPESMHFLGTQALVLVLFSFLGAYVFEYYLFNIHHHGNDDHHSGELKSSIPLVIIGDTIHNFIDGIAIGAGYLVNPGLGLTVALSTFLHEVPHEIGDFGVLLKAGWKRSRVLVVNVVSASFAIIGAVSVLIIANNADLIGGMMAVSAGIFLYLGAIDFLPHAHAGFRNRFGAIVPLSLGVLIMILVMSLVPHTHAESETSELDHSHGTMDELEHSGVHDEHEVEHGDQDRGHGSGPLR